MSLGIYKPGQGYWVRIMSAALAALLIAALAYWAEGQALVVAQTKLPKSGYRVGFEADQAGVFAVGDSVLLTTKPDSTGAAVNVGTATVSEIDAQSKRLITIKDVVQELDAKGKPKADLGNAGIIRKTGNDAKQVSIARGGVVGVMPIEPALFAGGVVAVVVLIGAGMAYWFIGAKPRTVEFLIATDFEMTKVNWSTPREIMGHTWVVIGACFLLAAVLWLVDIGLKESFTLIDLLPHVNKGPK